MLTILIDLFNFFIDSVIFCGEIGIIVGYGIVWTLSSVLIWIFLILTNTVGIIQILIEDFATFLREALDLSEGIAYGFSDVVEDISYGCVSKISCAYYRITVSIQSIIAEEVAFCHNLINLCFLLLKLIVDGLFLIGSVSKDCLNLICLLIYKLVTAPITSLIYISKSICNAMFLLKDTAVNLPLESAIGLFVVMSAAALYRKYNGNAALKLLILLLGVGLYKAVRLLLTVCIIMKWSIARSFRRIRLPSFSLRKAKNRKREESPSKIQLMKQLEQEMSLRMCVICMANPRDVIVMNCQHFCMCSSCAKQIRSMSNECPVCRKYIYRISSVYM